MVSKTIFILNGPSLNLLGLREPEIYGRETLADVEHMSAARAADLGLQAQFRQTNHEGQMIDWILEARSSAAGLIVNAGGWTHTSIAIMDALRACERPVIEVHLSNPYSREPFRHKSYVALAARGVICGLGAHGYVLAVEAVSRLIAAAK